MHEPAKIEKMETTRPLEELTENLVDESVPVHTPASVSRESALEPRGKSGIGMGKHRVDTHFPKDKHCDICLRTKMTRAPCRKRTGTAVPRADKFGFSITADHKVLRVKDVNLERIIDMLSWYKI